MGLRYSSMHVTECCGEMQGKFKVGLAQLIKNLIRNIRNNNKIFITVSIVLVFTLK